MANFTTKIKEFFQDAYHSIKQSYNAVTIITSSWFSGIISQISGMGFLQNVRIGMRNPYVHRAVFIIQSQLASFIIDAKQEVMQDGKSTFKDRNDHPFLTLLYRPNEQEGKFAFFQKMVNHLIFAGEVFQYSPKTPLTGPYAGRPDGGLYLIEPSAVVSINRDDSMNPALITSYSVNNRKGQTVKIDAVRINHIKFYNPENPDRGHAWFLSVLRAVQGMEEGDEWNLTIAKNKGRIPVTIKFTGQGRAGDEEQTQASIEKVWTEKAQRYLPFFLKKNFESDANTIKPSEAEWLQSDIQYGRKIAVGLGVDSSLLSDSANKTYSNFKEALRALAILTTIPLITFVLDEMSAWYMKRYGTPEVFLAIDKTRIDALKEDPKDVAERLVKSTGRPFMKVSEARQQADLEATNDPIDDVIWSPYTVAPAGDVALQQEMGETAPAKKEPVSQDSNPDLDIDQIRYVIRSIMPS